jgi:hypothetical protein
MGSEAIVLIDSIFPVSLFHMDLNIGTYVVLRQLMYAILFLI